MKTRINRIVSFVIVAAMVLCMPAPAFAEGITYNDVINRSTVLLQGGDVIGAMASVLTPNVTGARLEYFIDSSASTPSVVATENRSDGDGGDHTVLTLAEAGCTADAVMLSAFNGWNVESTAFDSVSGIVTITLAASFEVPEGLAVDPVDIVKRDISEGRFVLDFNYGAAGFPAFYGALDGGTNNIQVTWYSLDNQPELNVEPEISDTWIQNADGQWQTGSIAAGTAAVLDSEEFTLAKAAEFSFDYTFNGDEGDSLACTVYSAGEAVQSVIITEGATAGSCLTLEAGTYTVEFALLNSSGNGIAAVKNLSFATVLQRKGINSGGANLDIYSASDHSCYYNGFSTYCVAEIPMINSGASPASYTIRHVSRTATLTLNETEYTATFDANGGTIDDEATKIIPFVPSTGIPVIPVPVRESYVFIGWSDANPNDPSVTEFPGAFEIPFGHSRSAYLYAWWQAEEYTLTYETNGGTAINSQTFTVETDGFELPEAEKTGCNFLGWYRDFALTDKVEKIDAGTAGSFTAYAKWEEIRYTVSYEENGGDALADGSYTISAGMASLPVPVCNGYRFLGWYDNEQLEGEPIINIPIGTTGGKTFYADWEIITHTLTFNSNGGTEISSAQFIQLEGVSTLPVSSKLGCTFLGWYDNAGFNGEALASIPANTQADVTLYAKWFENIYTITYVTNGGNSLENGSFTTAGGCAALPEPVRDNYAFIAWYDNEQLTGNAVTAVLANTTAENITLYAMWEQEGFRVTYNTNGGNALEADSFAASRGLESLKTPEKQGYDFAGWFDNANFEGGQRTGVPAGTYEDVELYAKWKPYVYSVAYIENGGDAIFNDTFAGIDGLSTLKTTVRAGYTFNGWYESPSYEGEPVTSIAPNTMRTIILYAKWTLVTYDVVFNTNGGAEIENGGYTTATGMSSFPVPVREGYTFTGWHDNEALSGEKVSSIPIGSTGNKEFFAGWEENNTSFFARLTKLFSDFFAAIAAFFASIFA